MIKVLHITTLIEGGAARATVRLHQSLLDRGVDSKLLYLRGQPNNDIPNTFQYSSKQPSKFKKLQWKIWKKLRLDIKTISEKNTIQLKELRKIGVFDIFTFPQTNYRIHKHRLIQSADIIHLHWVADFIDWPSFFKYIKKPIVWTFHDRNPFLGGVHLEIDYYRNSKQFQSFDEVYRTIKAHSLKQTELLHIVCPSPSLAKETASRTIFESRSISSIPNSLKDDTFKYGNKHLAKKQLGHSIDHVLILFVGSHAYHKGFDILMESVARLKHSNITFLTVGVDRTRIKQNQIPANIIFLGAIKDDQLLATIYTAADATIITSREDNLPNVMLESWFCGTPVISVPVGGMKDSIDSLNNGMLSQDSSIDAIVQMITEFESKRTLFNNEQISKRAKKIYSAKKQAAAYISLYNEVLNS